MDTKTRAINLLKHANEKGSLDLDELALVNVPTYEDGRFMVVSAPGDSSNLLFADEKTIAEIAANWVDIKAELEE